MIQYKLDNGYTNGQWAIWLDCQPDTDVAMAISCLSRYFKQYKFRYKAKAREYAQVA